MCGGVHGVPNAVPLVLQPWPVPEWSRRCAAYHPRHDTTGRKCQQKELPHVYWNFPSMALALNLCTMEFLFQPFQPLLDLFRDRGCHWVHPRRPTTFYIYREWQMTGGNFLKVCKRQTGSVRASFGLRKICLRSYVYQLPSAICLRPSTQTLTP